MNYFQKLLKKLNKEKFVFTTRNIAQNTGNGERITNRSNSNSLGFDFISVNEMPGVWSTSSGSTGGLAVNTAPTQQTTVTKTEERKAVEPKEVFGELKKETPEISFENLPEKIAMVKERIAVLKEHVKEEHLGDEHRTLFYLENRLKYLKTKKKNPFDWAMTTQDAVEDLCKKYKLRTVPLKQYYTLVPKEGIAEMKRYTKAYKAITGDAPIYELVIKEHDVKTEEAVRQKKKDRDPILLANSPLGNFMFVVGVWDDEVEVVDEIIYGLK